MLLTSAAFSAELHAADDCNSCLSAVKVIPLRCHHGNQVWLKHRFYVIIITSLLSCVGMFASHTGLVIKAHFKISRHRSHKNMLQIVSEGSWEISVKLEVVFVSLLFQTRPFIHGGAAHEIRRRPIFDRRRGLQLRSPGRPVRPHLHRGLPYRQRTGR